MFDEAFAGMLILASRLTPLSGDRLSDDGCDEPKYPEPTYSGDQQLCSDVHDRLHKYKPARPATVQASRS